MLYSPGMKSNSFLTNCWGENQRYDTGAQHQFPMYINIIQNYRLFFGKKHCNFSILSSLKYSKIVAHLTAVFHFSLVEVTSYSGQANFAEQLIHKALLLSQSMLKQLWEKILILKGYFYGSRLTARNLAVADNRGRNKLGICAKHKHYFFTIWTDR